MMKHRARVRVLNCCKGFLWLFSPGPRALVANYANLKSNSANFSSASNPRSPRAGILCSLHTSRVPNHWILVVHVGLQPECPRLDSPSNSRDSRPKSSPSRRLERGAKPRRDNATRRAVTGDAHVLRVEDIVDAKRGVYRTRERSKRQNCRHVDLGVRIERHRVRIEVRSSVKETILASADVRRARGRRDAAEEVVPYA